LLHPKSSLQGPEHPQKKCADEILPGRGDLKLSATDFGFALGTFFLGYFIFEVPSNVIMEKVGAPI
jgi:hypothetical protein